MAPRPEEREVDEAPACFQNDDACFICHDTADEKIGSPERICKCAWLTKAGTCEETACRFCKTRLPDWKHSFDGATAAPVMSVVYGGTTHQIAVREGPEGRELFEKDIRKIFGLGKESELQLSFGVKVPDRRLDGAEDELTLEGWESFDAAVFCASLSAGARNERTKRLGAELETPDKAALHAGTASNANKRRSLETPGRVFRRLFGGTIEDGSRSLG